MRLREIRRRDERRNARKYIAQMFKVTQCKKCSETKSLFDRIDKRNEARC